MPEEPCLREHGRRLISGVRDGFIVVVRVAIVFMCFKLVEGCGKFSVGTGRGHMGRFSCFRNLK